MIKKLQSLKKKKGFTLVELIVVIAIIGVLAAILVPTKLGYVTSSRVTSADSTAASIASTIDTFLTNADTAGYGMTQANTNISVIQGEVDNTGNWTITQTTAGTFKTGSTVTWGTAGTGKANDTKVGVTSAEQLLAIELANKFPTTKSICFEASLRGGDCVTVWYTADTDTCADVSDLASGANLTNGDWTSTVFAWDTKTAGVSDDGFIVGTSPKLDLG